ncbi:MAG: Amino acid permease [Hydrogenibacillus schlegelii]|uniref:Amino acid permease n=1 Tax=Hydrogenibacillus schlegelii TaxID=1484 RepID=A0A2T5GDF7_HYDSH|nr:amino acid permease [Hydrogenibacillus schlegelii]PTQ54213.1 MAG: Amino acid permease [Hydrogenibacillus schlegelii]
MQESGLWPLALGGAALFAALMLALAARGGITYARGGRTYVGFVGISAVAMMDLLASVFYGPGEAFRYVGYDAMFYLVLTAVLIALYAFSMTEIAEVLEGLGQKGGGVFTLTYLVFGRTLSMVAVASILVDYVNMAALSAVSAVENAAAVFGLLAPIKLPLALAIVWLLTALNLAGIRTNVWTTFAVFLFLGVTLVAAVMLGAGALDGAATGRIQAGLLRPAATFGERGLVPALGALVVGVGSTILAYSGIETVLQTQKVVENWQTIRQAYRFLVVLNGLLIPAVGILALAHVPDPGAHVEGLVATYALEVGGAPMAVAMILAAALALAFAMNTAFVGGTELITVIAERYGLAALLRTNRFGVHHRIILFLAGAFTVLILITAGSANLIADMFAIGLLASFVLNLLGLVTFRITEGYARMRRYRTSLAKNLFLIVAFFAAFVYVASSKPHGTALWAAAAASLVALGAAAARWWADPDARYERRYQTVDELLSALAARPAGRLDVRFARPREYVPADGREVVITLSPLRLRPPKRRGPGHFILSYSNLWGTVQEMEAILAKIRAAFPDRPLVVHFGWPLSSWWDRLSMGFVVHRLLMLPKRFRDVEFHIDYLPPAKRRHRP